MERRDPEAQDEKLRSSMSIETVLGLIRGLEVPGDNDADRLAWFFRGPEALRDGHDEKHPQAEGVEGGRANERIFRIRAAIRVAIERALKQRLTTYDEIGTKLEMTQTDLTWVMQGMKGLTLVQFRSLCELLGVPADELLELPVRLPSVVTERLDALEKLATTVLNSTSEFSALLKALEEEIRRLRR